LSVIYLRSKENEEEEDELLKQLIFLLQFLVYNITEGLMKKIIIIIMCLLLISCKSEIRQPIKKVTKEEVEEAVIEPVEYAETNQLKEIVKLVNKKTGVVDLMVLHDLMSPKLLSEVNLNKNIDDQLEIVDEVILEVLSKWKKDKVEEVLSEENLKLNQDDLETVIEWSSYSDAYKVMSVYEVIFLKQEAEK